MSPKQRRIGSSPRLRGTALSSGPCVLAGRFIPAPAGNGNHENKVPQEYSVHPRACGERSYALSRDKTNNGSSPRLRGTASARPRLRPRRRFIPAPAGNGRGRRLVLRLSGRFIPAPAGNGMDIGFVAAIGLVAVHPRACGERERSQPCARRPIGSSPRLRGTAGQSPPRLAATRFIPAPAGNGLAFCLGSCSTAVHPRACGERDKMLDRISNDAGSSPRLRGTER